MTETRVSRCPLHSMQHSLKNYRPLSANTALRPQTTIPGARTPKVLQAARWVLDPIDYVQKNFKRYGDIFRAPTTPNKSYYWLSEPSAIQYLLTHDTGKEISAPGELNRFTESLIGRSNIIGSSGKQHQRRRKVVMPAFSHRNCLTTYSKAIQQATQSVIDQWQVGDSLDTRMEIQKITTKVILQVVFGLKTGDRYEALEHLLSSISNRVGPPTPASTILLLIPLLRKNLGAWSPGGRLCRKKEETDKCLKEIDKILFAEINERRANNHSTEIDVLSLLLAAKDEEGKYLSNQDLRDELMMVLMTGFETITIALTWAMYWIHYLPPVRHNLLSELNALPSSDDVNQIFSLPYLSAVCNETLRMNPSILVTFPRRVEAPLSISGYQFSPGDLLLCSIYSLHHREDIYPDPESFRPERFLKRQFSPYEFMPFAGGARRCIGSALAQCEMKVVLATILRQADLSLASNHPIKQTRLGLLSGPKSMIGVQVKKIVLSASH